MGHNINKDRLRVNPVEIGIFAVICGVFLHSGFKLVSEWNEFKERASISRPIGNRSLANQRTPGHGDKVVYGPENKR